MNSKKQVVQFIHQGAEHSKKSGVVWNNGNHKRKYIKVKGNYIETIESEPITDDLYFWGEWEAQSNLIKTNRNKAFTSFPKYIFEPFYSTPKGTENTDPFVFGNQFYYSICKQKSYKSLRNLDKGSLVLFGSIKDDKFFLDTLFVIKDWKEYTINSIKKLKKSYNDVSLIWQEITKIVISNNLCLMINNQLPNKL